MNDIKTGFKSIWQEDKRLLLMIAFTMVLAVLFAIFALVTLNPGNAVTKIGYGDIGGYRDGLWQNMLAWPLLGLALGVFNNLIAVKVYAKSGGGMARIVVGSTMMLILIAFIVLVRLLGES